MDCYIVINQFISTILLKKKKTWNYQKRNSYIMIVLSKWGKWQYECRCIFDINCKKKITVHSTCQTLGVFKLVWNTGKLPCGESEADAVYSRTNLLPSHSHLRHLDSVSDRQARCKFVSPLWPPPIYRLD